MRIDPACPFLYQRAFRSFRLLVGVDLKFVFPRNPPIC